MTAKRIVITERLGRMPDGIVPHDVAVDGEMIADNLNYIEARKLALRYIKPETIVIEHYESDGNTVETTGEFAGLIGIDGV